MKPAASVVGRPAATCSSTCSSAWLLACLLVLLGWPAAPRSDATDAPRTASLTAPPAAESGEAPPAQHVHISPPLYRAGLIDYVLGNRSRMIQIATLALLLGLFILMRK